MLSETAYEGTLSQFDPTAKTSRELRGKVKCNKRKPRDRAIALSDTVVTRADGTQYIIPRNSRSTSPQVRRRGNKLKIITVGNALPEAAGIKLAHDFTQG